jgi:hypothetical protein
MTLARRLVAEFSPHRRRGERYSHDLTNSRERRMDAAGLEARKAHWFRNPANPAALQRRELGLHAVRW